MTLLIALVGLCIGNLLNVPIGRQSAYGHHSPPAAREDLLDWVPILGTVRSRQWIALAVEVITALMAVVLFSRYGISARSLILFSASLVLIDTGAVDFKIRMIDTLILVVAMLAVLALAPLNVIGWVSSVLGLVLAGGLFLFLYGLAKVLFPREVAPFGLGDVYLAAFIGALVGLADLAVALFYGMAMAGVVAFVLIMLRAMGRKVPAYIAYGTYLCLGTLLFLATGSS